MSQHSFGWKRELPDQRDKPYMLRVVKPHAALRDVDLRLTNTMPPIMDQGSLGSCTANGWAFHVLFNILNKHEAKIDAQAIPFSRLFIYYNERALENSTSYDSGAYIRDGIKTIAKDGVCYEKTWPYLVSKYRNKPPAKAYAEALSFRAVKYESIDNTNKLALYDCMASGYPIVHGFSVYESFESAKVAKTGTVPMPTKRETLLGGHCTVIVGYQVKSDRFICANSWGTDWAQGGYYTIPAAYLTNPQLADDFWTAKLMS